MERLFYGSFYDMRELTCTARGTLDFMHNNVQDTRCAICLLDYRIMQLVLRMTLPEVDFKLASEGSVL